MKKKIISILLPFIIISCSDNSEYIQQENKQQSKEIVLKQRTNTSSFLLTNKPLSSKTILQETSISGEPLDFQYMLGRSYNLEDMLNNFNRGIKYPVVDVERYYRDHSGAFLIYNINQSNVTSSSFKTFNEYELNILNEKTKTIEGNVNLGLFGGKISLGGSKKYTTTFNNISYSNSNYIYGILNIDVLDKKYSLLSSPNNLDLIKGEYLSATFLNELYNNSASDFIKYFGHTVLFDFYTGGKAVARYIGLSNKYTNTQTLKKDMTTVINGSLTFNEDNGGDSSITIGKKNENTTIQTNSLHNVYTSIQTIGGAYGYSATTQPNDINNVQLNLTNWFSSLENKNRTVIVDIVKDGLIPITEFIKEDNIKFHVKANLSPDGTRMGKVLSEPKIKISYYIVPPSNEVIYNISLVTRFVDYLYLTQDEYMIAENISEFNQIISNFLNGDLLNNSPFKNLKIVKEDDFLDFASLMLETYLKPAIGFDGNNFQKFTDTNNNITYLLVNYEGNKIAYSIRDEYILNTYDIKDWVNSLTEKPLDYRDFKNYTIIAL